MDIMTKKQRSYNMSRIRGKWTSPEKKIHNMLKGWKIRHRMHPKIFGSPDIILSDSKTAVFIHGCFWHRCPKHFSMPKTRVKFWSEKIETNVMRDRVVKGKLRAEGYNVARIWEHQIRRDMRKTVKKIIS